MRKDNSCLRVLFIMGSMDIGGVQSGIMNFAKISSPEEVVYDVLVHSKKIGYHEAEFQKYGRVYHLPAHSFSNTLVNLILMPVCDGLFKRKLIRFLKQHPEYDVVHSKSLGMSAAAVEAAKKCGIPVRVAQSHVDKPERMNPISTWQYKRNARRIERAATHKLAVSEKAVELMFGGYGGRVIQNPTISLKRLNPSKYPAVPHEGIRLIQIGTYSRRKNQMFSIEIVKSLKEMGEQVQLTFVGYPLDEPDYITEVESYVKKLSIDDEVCFLPKDSDVPKLLSESDYMLVPSLREGLPNVALEAQAMGVSCFLSDTITKATDCGLCTFLPLSMGAQGWAKEVLAYRNAHGMGKRYVDMSKWDNEKVIQEYIKIWRNV